MLYSLTTDPALPTLLKHWPKVPFCAKQKTIEFKPGLNIVFGPNGSGKSTLVTTLAALLHCKQSGLQHVTEESCREIAEVSFFKDFKAKDPSLPFHAHTLRHDGDEVRFASAVMDLADKSYFDDTFIREQIQLKFTKRDSSAGQNSMANINRIVMAPRRRGEPVPQSIRRSNLNDTWGAVFDHVVASLVGKKEDGPDQMTLLLDEPERSMDFERQAEVWEALRILGQRTQVIVATHSMFALGLPDAHYIETSDDAVKVATKSLSDSGWVRNFVLPAIGHPSPAPAPKKKPRASRKKVPVGTTDL